MSRVCVNIVAVEKQLVRITYSECVFVALVIQHAMCISSAPYYIVIRGLSGSTILSSVACLALLYCHPWPVWLYYIVIRGLSGSTILSTVACLALLYCHPWPVWLYYIFPNYLINGTIFRKKCQHRKCVLVSSTVFVWNISHSFI